MVDRPVSLKTMQTLDEDIRAFRAVQGGDREAFRRIVERFQDPVYRVCLQFLADHGRAEDVAQETFITAFRKIEQFDPRRGQPISWLLTIARRLCINSTKKLRAVTSESLPETTDSTNSEPDHSASRSEVFAALDRALAELSPDHRRVFVLAEIEELPHAEIAGIEDIEIGTVKSRLSRAKKNLQACLQPQFKELLES